MRVLVKVFGRYMKAFLVSYVKKSVSKKLTIIKLAFNKSEFLNLIKSYFLNFINFDILDLVKSQFLY